MLFKKYPLHSHIFASDHKLDKRDNLQTVNSTVGIVVGVLLGAFFIIALISAGVLAPKDVIGREIGPFSITGGLEDRLLSVAVTGECYEKGAGAISLKKALRPSIGGIPAIRLLELQKLHALWISFSRYSILFNLTVVRGSSRKPSKEVPIRKRLRGKSDCRILDIQPSSGT